MLSALEVHVDAKDLVVLDCVRDEVSADAVEVPIDLGVLQEEAILEV